MTAPLPERVRECECSCHGSDKYLGYHFEPCCRECSLCRKRIPWGRRVSHAENCTAATITALRAENARLTSEVERLRVVADAARELVSWDWLRMVERDTGFGGLEADVKRLDDALAALDAKEGPR